MKRLDHNSFREKGEIDKHDNTRVNEEQKEKYGAVNDVSQDVCCNNSVKKEDGNDYDNEVHIEKYTEGGELVGHYVNTAEEQDNTLGNGARLASDTTKNELDGCYENTMENVCGEGDNYSNAIFQEHIVINKENDIKMNKDSESNAKVTKGNAVDELETEIATDSGMCHINKEISKPMSRLPNNATSNTLVTENKSFSHPECIISGFETLRTDGDEVKTCGTNRSADGNGVCSINIVEEMAGTESNTAGTESNKTDAESRKAGTESKKASIKSNNAGTENNIADTESIKAGTESNRASIKNVDSDDVPTYLPSAQVRSRRGAEIGSETLITNDVSCVYDSFHYTAFHS